MPGELYKSAPPAVPGVRAGNVPFAGVDVGVYVEVMGVLGGSFALDVPAFAGVDVVGVATDGDAAASGVLRGNTAAATDCEDGKERDEEATPHLGSDSAVSPSELNRRRRLPTPASTALAVVSSARSTAFATWLSISLLLKFSFSPLPCDSSAIAAESLERPFEWE